MRTRYEERPMPFSRHDTVEADFNGPEIITDTPMPPFGVAELLVDYGLGPDLFQFWLLSHTDTNVFAGRRFWRTGVLRECLPGVDSALEFAALGEPLR
jgi:hypothetical protein